MRLPESLGLFLVAAEVTVERRHQVCRCVIFEFPEGGHNTLRSRLDKRIDYVRHSLFADRSHAGVAGRERNETCIEMKISDVSNLEQAIIRGLLLRCEYKGGAIWDFRIDISMKSQVDDAGMAEREMLEVSFCRLGTQKNGAWFG